MVFIETESPALCWTPPWPRRDRRGKQRVLSYWKNVAYEVEASQRPSSRLVTRWPSSRLMRIAEGTTEIQGRTTAKALLNGRLDPDFIPT